MIVGVRHNRFLSTLESEWESVKLNALLICFWSAMATVMLCVMWAVILMIPAWWPGHIFFAVFAAVCSFGAWSSLSHIWRIHSRIKAETPSEPEQDADVA